MTLYLLLFVRYLTRNKRKFLATQKKKEEKKIRLKSTKESTHWTTHCFFKDNMGRGLSRGMLPVKLECAMLKGKKVFDVYSVDEKLMKLTWF